MWCWRQYYWSMDYLNIFWLCHLICFTQKGSPYVIFAWGENDPLPGQDIGYHGSKNRRPKRVNLISAIQDKEEYVSDSVSMDFTVANVLIFFIFEHF
jgi:hypothetical protein